MTEQEQNIAIAEACGWKHEFNEDHEDPEWYWIPPDDPDGNGEPPSYTTDLNAMHEAEKVLTEPQFYAYAGWLVGGDRWVETIRTTAPQRAEAFCKVMGIWEVEG